MKSLLWYLAGVATSAALLLIAFLRELATREDEHGTEPL